MKRLFLLLFLSHSIHVLLAQEQMQSSVVLQPLEVRGIIKDSTGIALQGAVVTLNSSQDSIRVSTNSEGTFKVPFVKSRNFYLSIRSLGYKPITVHYFFDNKSGTIFLEPIILKVDYHLLKQVEINVTPAIVYKVDTVEYQASQYKVRENAHVDELLKKMEGMEVGRDGSLTFQGQEVTRARLNGKDFIGGEVKTTIQNLPADIVDRVQIIDDYGEQASRTGIKDGDPKKILNLTTKADKSIGNAINTDAGVGNGKRYNLTLFGTKINANEVTAVTTNVANTVNGVANQTNGSLQNGISESSSSLPGSPGQSPNGVANLIYPALSFRNTFRQKLDLNLNYSFKRNDAENSSDVFSQFFTTGGDIYSQIDNDQNSISKIHNFKSEIEYNINKHNFLKFTLVTDHTKNNTINFLSNYQTGIIHQNQALRSQGKYVLPNSNGSLFYQHIFNKAGRNFSIQLSNSNTDTRNRSEQNNYLLYFVGMSNDIAKDSTLHQQISVESSVVNSRVSFTASEPISVRSQLQFNSQISIRSYDNEKITSSFSSEGLPLSIDSLNNIYKYKFTEGRISLTYRFTGSKTNFSLGAAFIPTRLSGENLSSNLSTKRTSFNVIPIFRVQYQWSRQHQIQLNYSGSPIEPTFTQLQPVRDITNPQRPVLGNPDLKNSFKHLITANYNNYLPNTRINYSANINATLANNQVVRNMVSIKDSYNSLKYETRFRNVNGNYQIVAGYSISKQLYNRKTIFSLNGNVLHQNNISFNNNAQNSTLIWRFNERFGPRLEPTEWLELNPYLSYDIVSSVNNLSETANVKTHTLVLSLDGAFHLPGYLSIRYSLSKNYIKGIQRNENNTPFVINIATEKKLFERYNGIVKISVFDLFNQNTFINRTISETSIIDTKTNPFSRYFLISYRQSFQRWKGTPKRNGKPLKRRGDGSFIN